ncbi:hypothetical protein BM86_25115 [Bacillus thuringiensis]|nr:hypothetical protein [Bacillus thuringiensis]
MSELSIFIQKIKRALVPECPFFKPKVDSFLLCVSHEQIMIRQVRIRDNICNFEGIVNRKTKEMG